MKMRSFNMVSPIILSFHFSNTKFLAMLTSLNTDGKIQFLFSKNNTFTSFTTSILTFIKCSCFTMQNFFFQFLFSYLLAALSLSISVLLFSLYPKSYCLIPSVYVCLLVTVFVAHSHFIHI